MFIFLFCHQGEDLVTANLGDSRAVLGTVSEKGEVKAVQLTTDLKPGLPSKKKVFFFSTSMKSFYISSAIYEQQ